MCETRGNCKAPARYWIQTALPKDAPHTTPNAIAGPIHPNRSVMTCGRHVRIAVDELTTYATDYLTGPGLRVAHGRHGVTVKLFDADRSAVSGRGRR